MDLFFLQPDQYAFLYNCSALSLEQWYESGYARPIMGITCICIGIVLQVVYLPFIITMLQPAFLHLSSYKLMLFLGLLDFVTIICSSLVSGYLLFMGAVFCTNPTLIYFAGLTGFASWCGSCITCMILTFNRCIDIYFPMISRFLFEGHRTWLWLLIPVAVIFRLFSMVFDPFHGMPKSLHPAIDGQLVSYGSKLHPFSNVLTVIVLCVGNSILAHYVFATSANVTGNTRLKRQFIIQVCVICLLFTCCSSIYAYMQFFYTPTWLVAFGSLTFNLSSGATAFTYLFLNPTLRYAASHMFCKSKRMERKGSSINPAHKRSSNVSVY
uniref:Uncharacterized protein n=1 Tax=Ditylenchus dipsaci TaxID=166011 RepID=A0A915DGR8_9BILA